MRPSIVLPVAAATLGLIFARGAWARAAEIPRGQSEHHWVADVQQRLHAGFAAPNMAYPDRDLAAEVSFDVGDDGGIRNPAVRRSSGSERVDRAVLDAVEKVGALPAPPPSLAGSRVVFRGVVNAARPPGPSR